MVNVPFAKEIDTIAKSPFKYSVCTLVSNHSEYKEMVDSFLNAGFTKELTEYIYIDNSGGNKYNAYNGINKFLIEARGEYIILCHQDILLNIDNREVLEKRITEVESLDPNWAVLGNAGGVDLDEVVIKISYPNGHTDDSGNFPAKVISVDENFILVKRSANLALSNNLSGFHLYGSDLCIIANIIGFSSYAIDFSVLHKSEGNIDHNFYEMQEKLKEKYFLAFKGRFIRTTCTAFYITGSSLRKTLLSKPLFEKFWRSIERKKLRNVKKENLL